ncbi:M13 family peptidase [Telmatospirillum siberiense]|uniref:M13 family peptidase n=2 Tax=Telmatospirillum siberiense TaxID=382514 RepID=A0A2N3PWU3_9PROT|nr:M13 family peptidase [Telmatospirillum siberiense]
MRGLLALAVCASFGAVPAARADAGAISKPMSLKEMVDPAISPCQDFFQYVCRNWQAANPIPDDQSRWGQFYVLREANLAKLRGLLENVGSDATREARRAGDFYGACMDEDGIEAKGIEPLKSLLAEIDDLAGKRELTPLLAKLHRWGISGFFAFGSARDPEDSERQIAGADQGGLGLPDRDFYFRKDAKAVQQRDAYQAHIAKMFTLAGEEAEQAGRRAKAVLDLETAMAEVSLDRVSRRDPRKVNKPMPFAQFESEAPDFDWAAYAKDLGAPAFDRINDQSSAYLSKIGGIIATASLDDVKSYLRWHLLHSAVRLLPKAFVEENFDFYGRTLAGTPALQPRWKRCVQLTDHALGEDLGRLFVARYYPPAAKSRMRELVSAVHVSFGRLIAEADWMTPGTKAKAQAKLALMASKIGYPDKWRDYSSVAVSRDDALGNFWRANAFEMARDLEKIGAEVDHGEWHMTPPTVNAYYSGENNDINFPAGILQYPFFDKDADDALNFGAIGMVIGHEMTHGFDDQGRQYDGKGNLVDWWTTEDARKFGAKSQCLVDEYGTFVAEGAVTLNGKLTLGENTADNGGARIAYWALKKYLAGKKVGKIDGWTPEQRFFIGMARVWCGSERPETRRLQAQVDPHSLAEYRVNGVVANMPEFARAFSCVPGDAMVRKDSCKVW